TNSTLTIPAGQTSCTITIPIFDDSTEDPDKRFEVALISSASASVVLDRWAAIGTIEDADGPDVTVSDVTVDEGQPLTFTIGLSRAGLFPTAVTYALAGTASAAHFSDDPGAGPFQVTFAPGELSKTITLHSIDDFMDGPDET